MKSGIWPWEFLYNLGCGIFWSLESIELGCRNAESTTQRTLGSFQIKSVNDNDLNQFFWACKNEQPQETVALMKTAVQQPGSGPCLLTLSFCECHWHLWMLFCQVPFLRFIWRYESSGVILRSQRNFIMINKSRSKPGKSVAFPQPWRGSWRKRNAELSPNAVDNVSAT